MVVEEEQRERATITWSYRVNKSLPSEEMSEQRRRRTGRSKPRGKQEKELEIWCSWGGKCEAIEKDRSSG